MGEALCSQTQVSKTMNSPIHLMHTQQNRGQKGKSVWSKTSERVDVFLELRVS